MSAASQQDGPSSVATKSTPGVSTVLDGVKDDICHVPPEDVYVENSLFLFSRANRLRQLCLRTVNSEGFFSFDNIILFCIALNSVLTALTDYENVDAEGNPDPNGSVRNTIIYYSEFIFLAVYTCEFLIKIVAFGFLYGSKNVYLRDPWNVLDFITVLASFLALDESLPNLSAVRTFRAFRPLRSVNRFPGLRRLVTALLDSLFALVDVVLLLLFVLTMYSILGMQLFQGLQHSRCRLTPHPVKMPDYCRDVLQPCWQEYLEDLVAFDSETGMHKYHLPDHICLTKENTTEAEDNFNVRWTKRSSPWHNQDLDCVWPEDTDDERVCSLAINMLQGEYDCPSERWCGSNYDSQGNARFREVDDPYGFNRIRSGTYIPGLNFGITNFDNIFISLLTCFQAITMEGWSDLMYQIQDAANGTIGAVFFVSLIIIGSFVMLSLVLAVVEDRVANPLVPKEYEGTGEGKSQQETTRFQDWEQRPGIAGERPRQNGREGIMVPQKRTAALGSAKSTEPAAEKLSSSALSVDDSLCANEPKRTSCNDGSNAVVVFPHKHDASKAATSAETKAHITKLRTAMHLGTAARSTRLKVVPLEELQVGTPLRFLTLKIIGSSAFANFMNLVILINTLVLAMDRYPTDREEEKNLNIANSVLTFVFTVESMMMVYALGVKGYCADTFNIFDGFIVLVSILELILDLAGGTDGSRGGGISALRSFRMFRVLKLARDWKSLQNLLTVFGNTVVELGNFFVLLVLFMFIYALLGMQFMANRFRFDARTEAALEVDEGPEIGTLTAGFYEPVDYYRPRAHFDTLEWSMTTIFQILTGENWNTVMFDGWRSTQGWGTSFYFVTLVWFGQLIMMSLFMALLLCNFDTEDTESKELPDSSAISALESAGRLLATSLTRSARIADIDREHRCQDGAEDRDALIGRHKLVCEPTGARHAGATVTSVFDRGASTCDRSPDKSGTMSTNVGVAATKTKDSASEAPRPIKRMSMSTLMQFMNTGPDEPKESESITRKQDKTHVRGSASLVGSTREAAASGLFPHGGIVRNLCRRIVEHKSFESGVMCLIIMSSIALAVDDPLKDSDSAQQRAVYIADIIFTILFSFELLLKLVAMGLVFREGAYFRDVWNVLDAVVVLISVVHISNVGGDSAGPVKSLRALRALRPLRMISRAKELKLIVDALVLSVPGMLNIVFICALFLLIFAIFGVSYLKGVFYACSGDEYLSLSSDARDLVKFPPSSWESLGPSQQAIFSAYQNATCYGNIREDSYLHKITSRIVCECLVGEGAWRATVPQNFDNVGNAMALLYEISSTEGWVDVMYAAVDNRGIGMQPIENASLQWIAFFVLFMFVGWAFVMNLFVGQLISSFNSLSRKGIKLRSEAQEEWARTQKLLLRAQPEPLRVQPADFVRMLCFKVAEWRYLEGIIMTCIILNTAVLGMAWFEAQDDDYVATLDALNLFFAGVFTFEAGVKVGAYGRDYFRETWNKFDFVIVGGTGIGVILRFGTSISIGPIASLVRIFRVGRIFRLIRVAKNLRKLFNTLISAVPVCANVFSVVALIFFIAAVVAVQLFARIMPDGENINDHANFQTFGAALLALVRFSTGENWNGFMYALESDREGCERDPGPCQDPHCDPTECGSPAAKPYFYVFTLVVTFVMINLFIAVVLDAFEESDESDIVEPQHIDAFVRTWQKKDFDPNATGHIAFEQLGPFLQVLDRPMGFGADYEASDSELEKEIRDLNIPVGDEDKGFSFYTVLNAVIRRVTEQTLSERGHTYEELPESDQVKRFLLKRIGITAVALASTLKDRRDVPIFPRTGKNSANSEAQVEEG